jgi:hypothetical protein
MVESNENSETNKGWWVNNNIKNVERDADKTGDSLVFCQQEALEVMEKIIAAFHGQPWNGATH